MKFFTPLLAIIILFSLSTSGLPSQHQPLTPLALTDTTTPLLTLTHQFTLRQSKHNRILAAHYTSLVQTTTSLCTTLNTTLLPRINEIRIEHKNGAENSGTNLQTLKAIKEVLQLLMGRLEEHEGGQKVQILRLFERAAVVYRDAMLEYEDFEKFMRGVVERLDGVLEG